MTNKEIRIIPFKGNNFVDDSIFLIGRIINYEPLSSQNIIHITKNENNIDFNLTGFTAYCNELLNENLIEVLCENGKMEGLIAGIKSVYEIKPNFIFGELVESLNGTFRKGYIMNILWHGKDCEFKYLIKDTKGNKISRQYTDLDLKKI